jgi:hypothetical protein
MNEMTINDPNDDLEEICVEAFLAPLGLVPPASRVNGRRRARARLHRLVLLVVVLIGLMAGIAVAAEDEETGTFFDVNGGTVVSTGPDVLIPVAPPDPEGCEDPSCTMPGGSPLTGTQPQPAAPPRASRHR